ncbi:MAG: T9SS type A sorting domain-containing protein [Bacteroidota bacterium]
MRYAVLALLLAAAPALAQPAGDCPYPVLFLHGYTGSQESWVPFTNEPTVNAIWGPRAGVFHAVLNAYENEERIAGPDGVLDTPDDDVLVQFANEDNALAPGCLYASNFENFWNENPSNPLIEINSGDSPGGFFASESDSNEESGFKQGYTLGRMIGRVLAANPGKEKVVLVGHSMGGLVGREYLQRREGGVPRWWVEPGEAGGHRVAKLVTVATPHRGSNLFGNPFPFADSTAADSTVQRDDTPDINSSATRDLRYNYFCFFCSSPGPYLFGGDEGNGFGWHTDDINGDGDDNDVITGINIRGQSQGFGDAWDGTTDNPAMPLPTDVRYTWITSDVGTSGDLVVDLQRQWLYSGSVPVPSDGTPYRMTDTLLTDRFHLDLQEDTDTVIRGLDEGDYPAFAYDIAPGTTYAGTATVRSVQVPDGVRTTDPDWYRVQTTGGAATVTLEPSAGLGGRLDFYDIAPGSYATGDASLGVDFAPGTASLAIPDVVLPAGTYFVRVRHDGTGPSDWRQPYLLTVTETALPDFAVTLTPTAPVPVVLARGERVFFDATFAVGAGGPASFEYWTEATLPNGSVRGPLLGPNTVLITPPETVTLSFSQRVPNAAPLGDYVYTMNAGPGGTTLASDSFGAAVTGGALGTDDAWLAFGADGQRLAPGTVHDLRAPEAARTVEDVGLLPSFPNPFRARTEIPYRLAERGPVRLTVYDALGRRVAVLIDETREAGAHAAQFGAGSLPSGVYVVRLVAGGQAQTQRITLVR